MRVQEPLGGPHVERYTLISSVAKATGCVKGPSTREREIVEVMAFRWDSVSLQNCVDDPALVAAAFKLADTGERGGR